MLIRVYIVKEFSISTSSEGNHRLKGTEVEFNLTVYASLWLYGHSPAITRYNTLVWYYTCELSAVANPGSLKLYTNPQNSEVLRFRFTVHGNQACRRHSQNTHLCIKLQLRSSIGANLNWWRYGLPNEIMQFWDWKFLSKAHYRARTTILSQLFYIGEEAVSRYRRMPHSGPLISCALFTYVTWFEASVWRCHASEKTSPNDFWAMVFS